MSIVINGNNNTVAGNNVNLNSQITEDIINEVPDDLKNEFKNVISYINQDTPNDRKMSIIEAFKNKLTNYCSATIVVRIIDYLKSML